VNEQFPELETQPMSMSKYATQADYWKATAPRTSALYAKIAAEMGLGAGKLDPAEAQNLILAHCRQLESELAEKNRSIASLERQVDRLETKLVDMGEF
jgi:hypothetical protein